MEDLFSGFRSNVIGYRQPFDTPYGVREIVYADWTASGRAYRPIEEYLQDSVLPFVGNTHTGTTVTGSVMSAAYGTAKGIVKKHVNAGCEDVLLFCGSGMTGAVNKLQRILGLRVPERVEVKLEEELRPVVFITHMEHHSNQVSWLETVATVEIIDGGEDGNVDLACFAELLERYRHRPNKIAAVTACSNVTGIRTPYAAIARMVHAYGGWCFVDFACSAPYDEIDMHPLAVGEHLDAIYFSPHKFLGGPGTPGVLIFNKGLYRNRVPDQPGGGTVLYSNPWKGREYLSEIEEREDGGTPPFLGAIRVAMCMRLKEEMGVANMRRREEELVGKVLARLANMENVVVLEEGCRDRLGVISFIVRGAHHHLIVKLLNDRYGIQMRGGCSCAGTYGHRLLRVDAAWSSAILERLRQGDLLSKPGWVRLSLHPIMSDGEVEFILESIAMTASHFREWEADYEYDVRRGEYVFKGVAAGDLVGDWFEVKKW